MTSARSRPIRSRSPCLEDDPSVDDHLGDVGRRGREHGGALVGPGAGRPRAGGVDGDQVGPVADLDLARVRETEAGVAGGGRRRRSALRRTSGRAGGWRVARPSRPRASPRRGRSPRGCRSPSVSGLPASCSCRLGPTPSPRSRSVVGQKQLWVPVAPRWAMSSEVRWVACTALVSGPSTPWSASSWAGVAPYAAMQPSFSCTCSLRCTCSGRPVGRRRPTAASCSAGHGADGVDRRTDDRAVVSGQLARPCCGPAVGVAVGVARLHALDRCPEPAGEVAGVEQRDPDAGLAGGLDQGAAHRVGVVVGRAVGLVVQVVELADGGDPGGRHLAVGGAGEREVGVGVEPLRRRRTSARARSRTCPGRAGSGPAALGGTRGCGSWPALGG